MGLNEEKTVRVWDLAVGREVMSFSAHAGTVNGVAWSRDGQRLVTAGNDRMIYQYAMNISLLVSLARRRVTRNFTDRECHEYLHLSLCPPAVTQ